MNGIDLLTQLRRVPDRILVGLQALGPRLITALAILLCGVVVAYVLRFIIRRVVAGLDRLIPSRRLRASLRTVDIGRPASEIAGTVVYWFVILVFLASATEAIGLPLVTSWLSGAARYLPGVLSALLITFGGLAAGVFVRDLAISALTRADLPNSRALGRLLQTVVVLVCLLIAVDQLGIDTTLLTALIITLIGMALLGGAVAFGLGARVEVSNILASHYLQKTYKIGHRIRIGDLEGVVQQITPTTVILYSEEGRVTVPARRFSEEASVLLEGGR